MFSSFDDKKYRQRITDRSGIDILHVFLSVCRAKHMSREAGEAGTFIELKARGAVPWTMRRNSSWKPLGAEPQPRAGSSCESQTAGEVNLRQKSPYSCCMV